jgi:response regulator RpfG family c-di-GMP phosphodiesterase
MPVWSEWLALAIGAWIVASCVLGLLIARVIAFGNTATEGTKNVREAFRPVEPGSSRRSVLIVDDDAPLRSLLRATLASDEFEVREAYSAEHALELLRFWRPEIVLLDVNLPGLDGLTLCAELARSEEHRDAAVILLTGEQISETTARMAGAKAVMRKPFSPLELLSLISRIVDQEEFVSGLERAGGEQLLMYARDLASIAQAERTQRQLLQEAYRQTATALADAVDVRDRATGLHAKRVLRYALGLAEAVDGNLLGDPSLEYGFLLHDVGKIGIGDHVLLKPGPLTDEERKLVHTHPLIGAQILRDVALMQGGGLGVVRHHHERWDGAGYPDGLAADQIPIGARIFAVADTLDAMTSDRPYRAALGWDEAVEEILAQSGRQFDPEVVQAFVAVEDDLRGVYEDLRLVA